VARLAIGIGVDGGFFVIGGLRDGRVLVQPAFGPPQSLDVAEFARRWSGELILVTTRAAGIVGGAFDVSWFIPALVKYRWLLGEVLAASLVIQLFALATPLTFQVVIDKVLVHKVLSTLNVLAIGLISVMVFDSVLSALRAYVFAHTTNRVDVELGAKLYRHLLGLPLAYFETRRVGDSVARVRELDTIREFLTSSSITLVIDLLFTVIFLVVMWFYSPWLLLIVLVAIALYAVICLMVTPALRVIVCLGAFAWDAALRLQRPPPRPRPKFAHLAEHILAGGAGERDPVLLASFHVSQQNTFTGRLTEAMFDAVLARALELAGG